MAEKLHESIKLLLQVLLPFGLLLASTLLTNQIPLQLVNKILVITETGLFLVAGAMNLFHFVRISLLLCDPPLCLRASCHLLRRLLLFLAVICGGYVGLSVEWLLLYPKQQLVVLVDFFYNVIELLLALFAIGFSFLANRFVNQQRAEPPAPDEHAKNQPCM